LSGRGLCDELITRPEESYRLCCVVVCDLEISRIGAPYIHDVSNLRVNDRYSLTTSFCLFYIPQSNKPANYRFLNVWVKKWSSHSLTFFLGAFAKL